MTPVRLLLPDGVDASAAPVLVGRALRAFADGYMAVLLPAYLLASASGRSTSASSRRRRCSARRSRPIAVGAGPSLRSSALLRGARC
jgi:hypothetical protein